MNRSSKFNFYLPQNTDPIEVSDFNNNFETIDANLLTKAQSLTEEQKAAVRANADLNVANNLTTMAAGSVLDARQGKVLNDAMARFKTTTTSEDDFNNCKSPGFYRGGSLTLNVPVTGYYALMVMPFSSGDLAQIAIEVNNRRMWFRTLHDTSTWTTWAELTKNNQVGDEYAPAATTLNSGSMQTLATFTPPANGMYIIVATLNIPEGGSSDANNILLVDVSETNTNNASNSVLVKGARATIQKTRIFSLSTSNTVYMRGYQNSGTNKSGVTVSYRWARIGQI